MVTISCDSGKSVLQLFNGFECFCGTEYSQALIRVLIDKGILQKENANLLLEEGGLSLTLSN